MAKVKASWRLKSPVLRCPYCRHPLVWEAKGPHKIRGPSKAELSAASMTLGLAAAKELELGARALSPASERVLYDNARAREEPSRFLNTGEVCEPEEDLGNKDEGD